MGPGKIVMIASGFPRRSETFILNELLALDARGMLAGIFATKPGDQNEPQPGAERLLSKIEYLAPGSAEDQAAELVARLEGRALGGIHACFAHTPAEVAFKAAARLGTRCGFSMHARDARKISTSTLAARIQKASCVVACNPDVVAALAPLPANVHVIPHGVDLRRFHPQPMPAGAPLQLVAVGRLVEKKGFDDLLRALESLTLPFHLRIVGEGPERESLQAGIRAAALDGRVELCGARTHAELPSVYARAHIVVVPSVEDRSGDRDGLPNVVLEAMACGRPVVASDIGAIRTAVADGTSGLVVPPRNVPALATALEALASRPDLRALMGRRGRAIVENEFDLERCTARLTGFLESVYA